MSWKFLFWLYVRRLYVRRETRQEIEAPEQLKRRSRRPCWITSDLIYLYRLVGWCDTCQFNFQLKKKCLFYLPHQLGFLVFMSSESHKIAPSVTLVSVDAVDPSQSRKRKASSAGDLEEVGEKEAKRRVVQRQVMHLLSTKAFLQQEKFRKRVVTHPRELRSWVLWTSVALSLSVMNDVARNVGHIDLFSKQECSDFRQRATDVINYGLAAEGFCATSGFLFSSKLSERAKSGLEPTNQVLCRRTVVPLI